MAYKRKRDPIPEEIEYNEKLREDIRKGIYRFISPEDADKLIKAKIATFAVKDGKTSSSIKWNEGEIQLRSSVILEYICKQGLSTAETVKQISDRWNVSTNTATRYVKEAVSNLTRDYDEYIDDIRKVHLERLDSLLLTALEDHREDLALKILDQMAKVNGLYEQKLNIDSKNDTTITFDFS